MQKLPYILHYQIFLLLGYFFILIPLVGIGIRPALLQNLYIPHFILDEIMKQWIGTVFVYSFLTFLFWVNIRCCLFLPYFLYKKKATIWQALTHSWIQTKGHFWKLTGILGGIISVFILLSGTLLVMLMIPLFLIETIVPSIAPIAAGLISALLQFSSLLLGSYAFIWWVSCINRSFFHAYVIGKTEPLHLPAKKISKWVTLFISVAFFLSAAWNGVVSYEFVYDAHTLIIAHRGDVFSGVENTLGSLLAAKKAGADLVEIDVQETKDGKPVVFHDTTLSRLAGRQEKVADLTLNELTTISVQSNGFADTIPSFAEYVKKAKALKIPLLVELKPNKPDSRTLVTSVIQIMRSEGVLDDYIIQSLDQNALQQVKK